MWVAFKWLWLNYTSNLFQFVLLKVTTTQGPLSWLIISKKALIVHVVHYRVTKSGRWRRFQPNPVITQPTREQRFQRKVTQLVNCCDSLLGSSAHVAPGKLTIRPCNQWWHLNVRLSAWLRCVLCSCQLRLVLSFCPENLECLRAPQTAL